MSKLDPVVLKAKLGANPAVKARFERLSTAKEAQEHREQQARELAERQAKEEAAQAAAKAAEEAARAAEKAAAEAARAAAAAEEKARTQERRAKKNKKANVTQVSGTRARVTVGQTVLVGRARMQGTASPGPFLSCQTELSPATGG